MAGEKLISVINSAGREDRSDTADLVYGVVTSASPLKILVDSRFEIGEDFIVLSALCKPMVIKTLAHKHSVAVTSGGAHDHTISSSATAGGGADGHSHSIPANTAQSAAAHSHAITEQTVFSEVVIWRGLQVADEVRMLRLGKGQVFYVIERKDGVV